MALTGAGIPVMSCLAGRAMDRMKWALVSRPGQGCPAQERGVRV